MQVTRNENHTPTAFMANIIAMDRGLLDIEDVADDYVHCVLCGTCAIRCPTRLFVGDFYQARTETVKVVRAARALMVDKGLDRDGWKLWCCGGPAAEMDYVEQSRAFAEHNVNDWRASGVKRIIAIEPHDYIHFTEDHSAYFGSRLRLRGGPESWN